MSAKSECGPSGAQPHGEFSAAFLGSFSDAELLEELGKRSLGCVALYLIDHDNQDHWHIAFKGSGTMLGVLQGVLQARILHALESRDTAPP